jgi:hypothetical protein
MNEFINLSTLGIGPSGASSEDDVIDRVSVRIGMAGIDEFAMPTTLLANKQFRDFVTCGKAFSEVSGIRGDGTRCGHEISVSTCREVNGKREFAAEGNKAAGNVNTRNGAGVPGVDSRAIRMESHSFVMM